MSIYDTGHELVDELKKLQDLLSSITDKFINKEDPEEDENIFETGTKEERDNKVKLALAIAAVSALVFVYRR
jgi:hypothetical protein